MNPLISIEQVSKQFGNTTAVHDLSLQVHQNELLALLGPSGCGKTTLLRMIAGLEAPTEGNISIDGRNLNNVPPNKRPINMVFQSYALFPHMTVEQNVGYGLKVAGGSAHDIQALVADALKMVRLDGFNWRKPNQLSGGQRQRVALARALVKRPRVLLLDEPLSALDANLREKMQAELTRLQRAVGITFIIVTHDQNEAMSMADRIAVMSDGMLAQVDSPTRLYRQPASRFVARFIGRVNLLAGSITGSEGSNVVVELAEIGQACVPNTNAARDGMSVAVRPENVRLSTDKPGGDLIAIKGTVCERTFFGDSSLVTISTPADQRISATVRGESTGFGASAQFGDTVWASWAAADCLLLGD